MTLTDARLAATTSPPTRLISTNWLSTAMSLYRISLPRPNVRHFMIMRNNWHRRLATGGHRPLRQLHHQHRGTPDKIRWLSAQEPLENAYLEMMDQLRVQLNRSYYGLIRL